MEEIKEACGIKIGEYIRTSGYDSFISKIKRIEFDNEARLFWFVYDKKDSDTNITREWRINKPYIKKHSQNIIDLVEVGDYVNGYKVYDISTEYLIDINKEGKILKIEKEGFINATITEGEDDIKSICTREQFAAAEYKLDN